VHFPGQKLEVDAPQRLYAWKGLRDVPDADRNR
jgi:hypothetical protein